MRAVISPEQPPEPQTKRDRLITGREADLMAGIRKSTRYKLEAAGMYPARVLLPMSRAVRYRESEILDWIGSLRRAPQVSA